MPIRSRMSSIMEQIKPKHPELFALEFGKTAEIDFVFTLASPNINQSAKPGHNVWDRKILKEFNYECYWDRIVRVICPLY